MLRPVPARWFEVLVAQDDAARALEALATTGAIELELHAGPKATAPLAELKPQFDAYVELAARYRPYWPHLAGGKPVAAGVPHEALTRALAAVQAWREVADPVIQTLQALEQELQELEIWHELFTRFHDSDLQFSLMRRTDGVLARRLYVFPHEVSFPLPDEVMARHFALRDQSCVFVLGPPDVVAGLDRQAAALKGRRSGLRIPGWIVARASDNLPVIEKRRQEVNAGIARLRATLETFNRRYDLATQLAEVERLRWFADEVHVLPGTDYFAWLTGWTSDMRGGVLEAALRRARVRAMVRFPPAPPGTQAPLVLTNPWWARPFELFARAIGVPSRNEVDPSPLLAIIVPLLFGYMFGDVGQGLVLLVVGVLLRRRFVVARLLIAGGLSAIVFGFLFGSVFALEHLIPALWLHPLAQPLTVLGVPLLLGALLLIFGLILSGVEAYWRGELSFWLRNDAGMLAAYVGALAGVFEPAVFWFAGLGIVWYVAGHAVSARRVVALLAGFGAALEHVFQLAVNTLSFARVGAFALAHAGLSSAVLALADAVTHPVSMALVLLIGNVIIIVLEGLVVSIQTTRLVLFEFFIRFLRAEGRAFHPLSAPHPNH